MPRRASRPTIGPIERLDLFCERVEELHRRRLIRGGFSASFTITGTPTQAAMTVTSPDKDDLDAYLTSLRHFVSADEPVFLDGVLSIAFRHITDPEMHEAIVRLGRWWRKIRSDRTFVFKLGDRALIARQVFDLYVNARVFHARDPEEARLLRQIEDPALPPIARQMLNAYIVDVSNVATQLSDVIDFARRDGKISPTPTGGPSDDPEGAT